MSDPRPVQFTFESAERIANVVRAVETAPRPSRPLVFDTIPVAQNRKVFRVATFTGAWSIDAAKTVTFKNQTATPNTVSATNLFFDIPSDGTKNCAVSRDGTAWYLVQWQWAIATCSTAAT